MLFRSTGSFTYTPTGNLLTKNLGAQTLSYGYNSSNRLVSVSGSESFHYEYDSRGNVIDNSKNDFVYNLLGQLTNSGSSSYEYDPTSPDG